MNTTTKAVTLSQLARRVACIVRYGASAQPRDDWQRQANGYRVTLRYHGRQYSFDFWRGPGITRDPDSKGCLSCLLSDSQAGDQSFDDFCSELGYDPDSRKAEQIWQACRKVGPHMRRLLGDDYETFLYSENDV